MQSMRHTVEKVQRRIDTNNSTKHTDHTPDMIFLHSRCIEWKKESYPKKTNQNQEGPPFFDGKLRGNSPIHSSNALHTTFTYTSASFISSYLHLTSQRHGEKDKAG